MDPASSQYSPQCLPDSSISSKPFKMGQHANAQKTQNLAKQHFSNLHHLNNMGFSFFGSFFILAGIWSCNPVTTIAGVCLVAGVVKKYS